MSLHFGFQPIGFSNSSILGVCDPRKGAKWVRFPENPGRSWQRWARHSPRPGYYAWVFRRLESSRSQV